MDMQKLAKVLAMAGSDNETEAVHALRMAKRILTADGLDFVDLARNVSQSKSASPQSGRADDVSTSVLHDAIFDLRNEVRQLRAENQRLKQAAGSPGPSPSAPPSFQDSAREAASLIRLRSELTSREEELARLKEHEEVLRRQLTELVAEADELRRRLGDSESRRMRCDVENRRLLHANHALDVENCQLREELAQKQAALAAPPTPAKLPRPSGQNGDPPPKRQYSLL